MAIPTMTHNSPSPGFITWGQFTIQYSGVGYVVSTGSTSQRWVWWRYNGGAAVIEAGPDIPANLTDDDLVLFGNKLGIGARVQSSTLIDGELLVDGTIFASALSTDSVTTNAIKAGSVVAESLFATAITGKVVTAGTPTAVGVPTGLIVYGPAEDGSMWTLPGGHYYYRITGTNFGGETTGSVELDALNLNPGGCPELRWNPLPDGTTGVNIYRNTPARNAMQLIASLPGIMVTSFIDVNTPGVTAVIPVTNTMANANQIVRLDNSGIYAGSTAIATAPFAIDPAGNINAPKGTITGQNLRTAATGKRIEFGSATDNKILFHPDATDTLARVPGTVVLPGSLEFSFVRASGDFSGPHVVPQVEIRGPLCGPPASEGYTTPWVILKGADGATPETAYVQGDLNVSGKIVAKNFGTNQTATVYGANVPSAGTVNITNMIYVEAMTFPQLVSINACAMIGVQTGSGPYDIIIRKYSTNVAIARGTGINHSPTPSWSEVLPAGVGAGYVLVGNTATGVTISISNSPIYTYMRVITAPSA